MRFVWALLAGFLSIAGTAAKDVAFVQVAKFVTYVQTNGLAPLLSGNAYGFRARVELTRPNSIASATLKWPSPAGASRSLSNLVSAWEFSQVFPTTVTLNIAHPNGTYTMVIESAADGRHTNVVTLSADVYPNPVHVANFNAAQAVNAHADFALQWDPPGTGAGDLMQVRIFSGDQLVYETGSVPGASGSLSGSATRFTIPKNTLADGAVYRAQVIATRRSTADTTGYPGVTAWAMYSRATEFTLRTVYPTLDVLWYGVAKVRRFAQDSVLPPSSLATGGFALRAFAIASDAANLKAASLKSANGTERPLIAAGESWSASPAWDTLQGLDSNTGAGNYELSLQTAHNGSQRLSLPLGAAAFPVALQIANWSEASSIDSGQPFVLRWLAVPGGNSDDFAQVTVVRNGVTVFQTGIRPGAPNALTGTSSSATLPAGLIPPGESAEVNLLLLKAASLDLFSYPQAVGMAAFGSETRATLRASGGQITPPDLSGTALRNGFFEFTFPASLGRQYIIQSTGDFRAWNTVLVTNAPGTPFTTRFPANQGTALFRVVTY